MNPEVRVWTADPSQVALDEAGIEIPFPHLQLFVDDVSERVWAGASRWAQELPRGATAGPLAPPRS